MNSTFTYNVGSKLRTVYGEEGRFTIIEFTVVPESDYELTHARYRFVAQDFTKKTKVLNYTTMKWEKGYQVIKGAIDQDGRWFIGGK